MMVHMNVSVHTIIVNIHLLVTYAILPVGYCTDAPLRRYAMLIVAPRIGSGRAKWCKPRCKPGGHTEEWLLHYFRRSTWSCINDGNISRFSYPHRQTHIIGQVRRHYQDYAHSSRLFLARKHAVAFCAAKRQSAVYHTREAFLRSFCRAHADNDWEYLT